MEQSYSSKILKRLYPGRRQMVLDRAIQADTRSAGAS
jgi:hypothetical protein